MKKVFILVFSFFSVSFAKANEFVMFVLERGQLGQLSGEELSTISSLQAEGKLVQNEVEGRNVFFFFKNAMPSLYESLKEKGAISIESTLDSQKTGTGCMSNEVKN